MRKTLSRENVIFAPIFTGFPSAPAVPFCFQPAHSSCFVCLVFLDLHPQGLWALQILCFEESLDLAFISEGEFCWVKYSCLVGFVFVFSFLTY